MRISGDTEARDIVCVALSTLMLTALIKIKGRKMKPRKGEDEATTQKEIFSLPST